MLGGQGVDPYAHKKGGSSSFFFINTELYQAPKHNGSIVIMAIRWNFLFYGKRWFIPLEMWYIYNTKLKIHHKEVQQS